MHPIMKIAFLSGSYFAIPVKAKNQNHWSHPKQIPKLYLKALKN